MMDVRGWDAFGASRSGRQPPVRLTSRLMTQQRMSLHVQYPGTLDTGTTGAPRYTISSQYQRGRKPTRSSFPTTSSTRLSSSLTTFTPSFGTKFTRHTVSGFPSVSSTICLRKERNCCPQSRHNDGSHAPGLPRTRRGISPVLNDCTSLTCPDGVRNPTMIS